MEEIDARRLLTPVHGSRTDFFYSDWNMNLYHGCCHGCIYCDSRSLCYHLQDFDTIRPKRNALALLEDELRRKRRAGVVSMGAMTDPYNPLEERLLLTRGALQMLKRYGFGAALTTKSALVARDAALLADIARAAQVCVQITVTCADDALCRRIEPNVSPTSERLATLRTLAEAGVYAGVWINPMLPFITDSEDNLVGVLHQSAAAGARFAVCFFSMTLRSGNREYFFDALQRDFPGVRDKYLRTYGNAYECTVPDAERLYARFKDECERLGLAWRFREINEQAAARAHCQLSLFDP